MRPSLLCAVAVLLARGAAASGSLMMPSWFGDDMVLQTNIDSGLRAVLHGRAAAGEVVTVREIDEATQKAEAQYEVVADEEGEWAVQLTPIGERGHTELRTIVVSTADGGERVARRTLRGFVLFCSGQSNMQLQTAAALNATAEVATLSDPHLKNIRFFMTPRAYSATPQFDVTNSSHRICDAGNNTMCGRWLTAAEAVSTDFASQFSGVCWMTARDTLRMHGVGAPMGVVQSAWGGTPAQSWVPKAAYEYCDTHAPPVYPSGMTDQHGPSMLYNTMIYPFRKMVIGGALWYQGEADSVGGLGGAAVQQKYACLLTQLVRSWRADKQIGDFPFIIYQLTTSMTASPAACTEYTNASTPTGGDKTSSFCGVRLAQASGYPRPGGALDNTGLVVTYDLPGQSLYGYIHPPNKAEVARRGALQLLRVAYGRPGPFTNTYADPPPRPITSVFSGPVLDAVRYDAAAAQMALTFKDDTSRGMHFWNVSGANYDGTVDACTLCCPRGPAFEVHGDAGWAPIPNGDVEFTAAGGVVLPGVPQGATAVRYAYSNWVECAVRNEDDLPMVPFLVDVIPEAPTAPGSPPGRAADPLSPPMGWNDWNYAHANIDEQTVLDTAALMASLGLRDLGYQYINIDDGWQVARDEAGRIVADDIRFPSGMKAVADAVHAEGFKFGVYTAAKEFTCQSRPGSWMHEAIDAATYCEWGVDYLKIDRCKGREYADANTSWTRFRDGLNACTAKTGRAVLEAVSSCNAPDGCGTWVADVADLWRVSADIQATWSSIVHNALQSNAMREVARPGKWNDADMLQVGNVGLSLAEQRAHFSMWCVISSPLLIATNLHTIAPAALAILKNAEAIAVNQDLGVDGAIQGRVVIHTDALLAWVKPLSDGRVAAVLVNLGNSAAPQTLSWQDAHLSGPQRVRDIWRRRDVGTAADAYQTPPVAAHDAAFLIFAPEDY